MENPIREGSIRLGRLKAPATIAVGLTTLAVAGVLSFAVLAPDRSSATIAAPTPGTTDNAANDAAPTDAVDIEPLDLAQLAATALADRSYEPCPEDPQPCVKVDGATPASATVVLIGDSTAQSYDPALKALAETHGFRYVQAAVGGCPVGHRLLATGEGGELHKPSNFLCFDELPGIYKKVVEEYQPALIIATSWNETNQHVEDDRLLKKGTPEHLSATEAALRETVDYLTSGGAIIAFLDVLPPGRTVECLETAGPDSDECTRPVTPETGEAPYNGLFHQLAAELESVVSITLLDVLCPNDSCPLTIRDVVMRYDGNHLTATGSRELAPIIDSKLSETGIDLSQLADGGST
jgi:hypothetical protein